jgi:hypothetical protein
LAAATNAAASPERSLSGIERLPQCLHWVEVPFLKLKDATSEVLPQAHWHSQREFS